jgi:hypothetical protein
MALGGDRRERLGGKGAAISEAVIARAEAAKGRPLDLHRPAGRRHGGSGGRLGGPVPVGGRPSQGGDLGEWEMVTGKATGIEGGGDLGKGR